jgi:hypothetical protein
MRERLPPSRTVAGKCFGKWYFDRIIVLPYFSERAELLPGRVACSKDKLGII